MRLYHGTASTFVPSIESSGLVWNPAQAQKTVPLDIVRQANQHGVPWQTAPDEFAIKLHGIYITSSKETAKAFARFKANYLKAKPGTLVWEYPNADGPQIGAGKSYDAPQAVKDAEPVVIELDVPETLVALFHKDAAAPRRRAYWYDGTIPAEYIVKVDKVTSKA